MSSFIQRIAKEINSFIQYPDLVLTYFNKINRGFAKDLFFIKKVLRFNFDAIINVEAAIGEFSKAANFVYPNAKIYAFEPVPNSFNELKDIKRKIKNFECFNIALSNEKGESKFHLNEFSYSSSLLDMTNVHKRMFPFTKNEITIKVSTDTLDNLFYKIDVGNILLKMDVQGAELMVLKGGVNLLNKIKAIYLEVSLLKFYQGQAEIEEIISFLKIYGFSAFLQINPVLNNNQLLYSDFLFFRNE